MFDGMQGGFAVQCGYPCAPQRRASARKGTPTMCCFSGPVRDVADTKIFARRSGANRQILVYSMKYTAARPVAMILPLPVAGRSQRALRFINLQRYPDFFDDMQSGFPQPRSREATAGGLWKTASIPVHDVGDFVASFVPSLDDFSRLDPRFVLPRQTWDRLPAYRDYGFAVFQLRGSTRGRTVHPMAMEFDTRMPQTLFFPTVHIHDGKVHAREHFDHALFFQTGSRAEPSGTLSTRPASAFMDVAKARGVIAPAKFCHLQTLKGTLPNQDTLVRV
jgi:hypothetical protein